MAPGHDVIGDVHGSATKLAGLLDVPGRFEPTVGAGTPTATAPSCSSAT
ncbi:MAG: hypothetical protein R2690_20260 [Acidimicrobiales bacterium]